ncbi:sensor histidine kinase [Streptomyces armeniacus]|uniref:histidine kinase n=1 Tax=Streptomyces armeniacus TaxID=83291 RepID=A0A345XMP4_9ACTN|nr:HAMP domain-containing sensor histidine kinase [Streptomyces armeniacus]AXK32910.1 sensor histidine kinase [Streptomyces armeniacus]
MTVSPWRRPRSLSAQLTARNVLLLAVALVLAAGVAAGGLYTVLVRDIDSELRSSHDAIRNSSFTRMDAERLVDLVGAVENQFGAGAGNGYAMLSARGPLVLTEDGEPVEVGPADRYSPGAAARRRAIADAVDDPAGWARSGEIRSFEAAGVPYRAKVTALRDGGYIVAVASTESVRANVTKLIVIEAVTGAVLLSVLAVASLVTARRRLRPLGDMVDTATAIADGELTGADLARRVEPRGRDATEVARLRTALNAMLHQIEGAFETRERSAAQLRRFAADASHELRTPLASVRGYLQLYERGMLDGDEERSRALARMTAETERMARLVNELLLLARLDRQPELRPRAVDLARVAADALDDLTAQQPERPVHRELPAEGCPVLADEATLRQIVGNLVANVRVHTPPEARVRVRVAREGGPGAERGVLCVADTGPGMEPADADRIFDRFFRAPGRGSGSENGSGLGMSVVRAGTEAQGGTVRVATAPGEGLAVTVTLPAAVPGAAPAEGDPAGAAPAEAAPAETAPVETEQPSP